MFTISLAVRFLVIFALAFFIVGVSLAPLQLILLSVVSVLWTVDTFLHWEKPAPRSLEAGISKDAIAV